MPLVDLDLPRDLTAIPADVRSFLLEAERRIERFQQRCSVPGFVPSDFSGTYVVLRALAAAELAPGSLFCEWGSGFGVVACLAAMLDFDACGIEIEADLVDAARQLAADYSLPVEFIHGTFIPRGGEARVCQGDGFAWLHTDGGGADPEPDLAPDDPAVIFAYPWPDEEGAIGDLFERYAAEGALLVTHHGGEAFRLRRKRRSRVRDKETRRQGDKETRRRASRSQRARAGPTPFD